MQMYDFPFAIHSYSDGSEAHVRALIQASDEGHISVLADLWKVVHLHYSIGN